MNSKIQFFSEEISYRLKNKGKLRSWLVDIIRSENQSPWYINFIFCTDKYLLELNRAYLSHDTYTDIITFPFNDESALVSGDIYISIERVAENSDKFSQPFEMELYRVMAHGILHLLGYNDKLKAEKTVMSAKEDFYLRKLSSLS